MTTFSSQSVASLPHTSSAADSTILFDITDSTQNIAREMIQNHKISDRADGKPPIYAIAANAQTAGRGRLGRAWVSRPGESFLVSFVTLLPKTIVMDESRNGWLPIIAGLSARDALLETFKECGSEPIHGNECSLKLKWPNDVFLHDCKEGGILTEIVAVPDRDDVVGVVFGIGLNLCVPQEVLPIKMATSLQMHMTALPEAEELRDRIAAKIVDRLRSRLCDFMRDYPSNCAGLLKELSDVCWTLGREVNVHPVDGRVVTGTAVRVGEDASLTIREDSGEEIVVKSGDVQAVAYEE
ncbi:biotin--[acetyl-CoA-carboxylase] ligase [Gardnerella vaginalis]|uniref:biotin--[acetyl-CoA-carboxylase] ligase n=1 Tax=Gardnerella vaginalis TaxID=2702 RepID=UPI0039EF62FC